MLLTVYIAYALTGHVEQSTICNYSGMTGGIISFKQKNLGSVSIFQYHQMQISMLCLDGE